MKILDRQKIAPIWLSPGDTLVMTHTEPGFFGRKREIAKTTITADQLMMIDEAVLIETEFEGRRALGGLLLERQK